MVNVLGNSPSVMNCLLRIQKGTTGAPDASIHHLSFLSLQPVPICHFQEIPRSLDQEAIFLSLHSALLSSLRHPHLGCVLDETASAFPKLPHQLLYMMPTLSGVKNFILICGFRSKLSSQLSDKEMTRVNMERSSGS